MGRQGWLDLLSGLRQARIRRNQGRYLIGFSEAMTIREVEEYRGLLPQTVKSKRNGKTLIIETPEPFNLWLKGEEDGPERRWSQRILNLLKR